MGLLVLQDDEYPVTPNRLLVCADDADQVRQDIENLRAGYAPQPLSTPRLTGLRVLQDIGVRQQGARPYSAVTRRLPPGRVEPSYAVLLGAIREAVGGPECSGPQGGKSWTRPAVGIDGPSVVVVDNG